jgi:choline kinase
MKPLDFYNIGIFYSTTADAFAVLVPSWYYEHDLLIFYDDHDIYEQAQYQPLKNAISDAFKVKEENAELTDIPIIVMKNGQWMEIETDSDVVAAILAYL